jgi:hypothetical protein
VLEADGRHLLTDVWTSGGVIVGVALVALTGIERLDPLVALLVAGNIVFTGIGLVRRSIDGLMDRSLPSESQAAIIRVIQAYATDEVTFHALRTRQAGSRSFVSLHVLVPGSWTVHAGHALLERLERDLRGAVPGATVFTHLEPIDDPESFADTALDAMRRGRPSAMICLSKKLRLHARAGRRSGQRRARAGRPCRGGHPVWAPVCFRDHTPRAVRGSCVARRRQARASTSRERGRRHGYVRRADSTTLPGSGEHGV